MTNPKTAIILPTLPLPINEVRRYLPHAYPFVMIDRVTALQLQPVASIGGFKNVSINEEYFQGHFPNYPVMPGVMIMEALAQLCGILGMILIGKTPSDGANFLFAGMDNVRFKRQVVPGDCLQLRAELLFNKRGIFKFSAYAMVDDTLAAQADIILSQQQLTS